MSSTAQILYEDIVDLTTQLGSDTCTMVAMTENVECMELVFADPIAPHLWQMLSCPSIASVESNYKLIIDKSYEYPEDNSYD